MNKRRICAIMVDRANYGRLRPVLEAIQVHPGLELEVVCSGSMVLERFGRPVEVVRQDGFEVVSEIYMELEGSTPLTMAKSLGMGVNEFATVLDRIRPDIVLLIGDRYEALSAALATSYLNLCLAHVQGGEVSGSIDETARHCITKLAQYHFPATLRSADYIVRMGERPETVFCVGCPSGDIVARLDRDLPDDFFAQHGSGAPVSAARPFLLVVFHPVTTEYGNEVKQVAEVIEAIQALQMQTVWLWPNIDAGANLVSKALRIFGGRATAPPVRFLKNLPPEQYLKVLGRAACAIGNSSSFVRDSSFFGTPVVLVGDRQTGREIAENVVKVEPERNTIVQAARAQMAHGQYPPSLLYGGGHASEQIADHLAQVPLYCQKTLAYVAEPAVVPSK